jgi:hypothetical protein
VGIDLARGRRVPAWALSAALHTLVFVSLALLVRGGAAPRAGNDQDIRYVGVVLARAEQGSTSYFDEAASHSASQASSAGASPASFASALPASQELSLDLGGVLPSAGELGGGAIGDLLPSAGDLTAGGGAQKSFGGQARTEVYGLSGQGSKFIYVFDRSGSMSGYEGRPLRSAKAELIASLNDLQRTHQFQIIFYNQRPSVFAPDGRTPRLVWGDDAGKAAAARYVRGIIADGGTEHMAPMMMALALRPDVIYFLTDADEPKLNSEELDRIRRVNKGTIINAIEFGFGPAAGEDNFLKRLARQNEGQHAYVDISKLPE